MKAFAVQPAVRFGAIYQLTGRKETEFKHGINRTESEAEEQTFRNAYLYGCTSDKNLLNGSYWLQRAGSALIILTDEEKASYEKSLYTEKPAIKDESAFARKWLEAAQAKCPVKMIDTLR